MHPLLAAGRPLQPVHSFGFVFHASLRISVKIQTATTEKKKKGHVLFLKKVEKPKELLSAKSSEFLSFNVYFRQLKPGEPDPFEIWSG